jgi:ABC-2 type transport system permease protein
MDTTLDLSRWQEKPLGLAYRRWTITSTGLRMMLRMKFYRIIIFLAWTAGVGVAAVGFLFVQSVASGGWLESIAANFGPRGQAVVSAFCGFLLLYPDIIIRGLFTTIFWGHAGIGLFLSMLALTVMVPRLVTRDRANNAFTIYFSRPLTSTDYLLGKLGMIVGMILLLWTGPLLFGWLLSMLFAPDRDFVVYSLSPLLRALAFNLIGMVSLASIALGVSSLSKSTLHTILIWIGMWFVLGGIASVPLLPIWIRRASFTHNLEEARTSIFAVSEILYDAAKELPLADRGTTRGLNEGGKLFASADLTGALIGLAVIAGASSFVFFRKLRPE